MSKKEEKAKESIQAFYLCKTKKYGCRFVEKCMYCDGNSGASECDENCSADEYFAGFCSGWHAAMEYLYRLPIDTMVKEVINEVKTNKNL